jgi:hypothetical protein
VNVDPSVSVSAGLGLTVEARTGSVLNIADLLPKVDSVQDVAASIETALVSEVASVEGAAAAVETGLA